MHRLDGAVHCDGPGGAATVLLVPGTGDTPQRAFSPMWAPQLRHLGYRVCEVTLPLRATGDIQVSAEYVARAAQRLGTLAARLVVLTHSQGALEARWALKYFPTAQGRVSEVVELGAPNHGISTVPDVCRPGRTCQPAAMQMAIGSRFLHALNTGTATPGGASYVSFYSLTDEIIRPVSPPTAALAGARNVAFQSICPARAVSHAAMLYDPWVFTVVSVVIGRPGAPLSGFAARCIEVLPRSPFTHSEPRTGQARPGPEPALAPYVAGSGA
ncbi:MAG TPA: hypothetical protein VFA83_20365 [Acidimicrobiales bacterium]|nr:hypothetical protein [Acidimicrobiales bacterium]